MNGHMNGKKRSVYCVPGQGRVASVSIVTKYTHIEQALSLSTNRRDSNNQSSAR